MNARHRNACHRKNRPWIALLGIGGAVALATGAGDGGFFLSLVAGRGGDEVVFHAAWIAGLALGLTAVAFDEVLGMADGLRQREIDAGQLFWSRLRGIGGALVAWLIGLVGVSWLLMCLFEQAAVPDAAAVGHLLASAAVALPAAAIGLFAASLPLSWPWRLGIAGTAVLVVLSGIPIVAGRGDGGCAPVLAHVGLDLLAAAAFTVAAFGLRGERPDADRPLSRAALGFGVAPAVLLLTAVTSAGLLECESSAVRSLHRTYPCVVRGDVDGASGLAVARDEQWLEVDGEHRATGKTLTGERVDFAWPGGPRGWLGFSEPWWHGPLASGWVDRRQVVLARGRAFVREFFTAGAFEPTGKGAERAPFGPAARLFSGVGRDLVVVYDPGEQLAYRFDRERGWFVPWQVPGAQRVTGVEWYDPQGAGLFDTSGRTVLLHVAGGAFAVRGDELVPVQVADPLVGSLLPNRPAVSGSPLGGSLEIAAAGGHPAFRHEFRPRTAAELWFAWLARGFAACQPPLFLIASRSAAVTLGALAVALGGALLLGHQLRRFGAATGARRFWFVSCLLLGPCGMFWASWFELRRRWASRPVVAPTTPRIVTAEVMS